MISSMLDLCLARHMARIYGDNEAKALARCARARRKETTDPQFRKLLKAYADPFFPAYKKVEAAKRLEVGMRVEGLL